MDGDLPAALTDYHRRDQASGITAPNLLKSCSFAEHIVRARGKRTQYTSVSLDPAKIRDFGDATYRLKREELSADGHVLVEHAALVDALRKQARDGMKADRLRAIQALRYATRRLEGLVDWRFDISGVIPKDALTWAQSRVAAFFVRT